MERAKKKTRSRVNKKIIKNYGQKSQPKITPNGGGN